MVWGLVICFIIYMMYYSFIKLPLIGMKHAIDLKNDMQEARYRYNSEQKLIEELQKNDYLQSKQLQDKILEQDKKNKSNNYILQKQNEMATAAINKVSALRTMYPFANEELFKLYLNRYSFALVDELNDIEKSIKQSHNLNKPIGPIERKTFNLNDLNGMTPIEEHREDPIVVKLFKMDNINYVIYIRDIDTERVQLINANDYVIITKTINNILNKQRAMKERKSKITSKDISEIYDNVSLAINRLRREGAMNI